MIRVLTIPGGKTDPGYFGKMVAFSLVMHVLFSLLLLLGHPGRSGSPTVQYIDLKMTEPAVSPSTEPKLVSTPPGEVTAPDAPDAIPQESAVDKPAAAEPAAAQPDALPPASFGFGLVNGRFGGISDGRTLRDDMREYYLGMLDRFNESWWKAKSADTAGIRGAAFLVTISRAGEIIDAQLLESSGNRSYDRLMLQSLKTAGPMSPLPDSYEADFFSAPLRFVGPLNLMSPFSG